MPTPDTDLTHAGSHQGAIAGPQRDLPAIELALAVLLATTTSSGPAVWGCCTVVCAGALLRGWLTRNAPRAAVQSGQESRKARVLAGASGLLWGGYLVVLNAIALAPGLMVLAAAVLGVAALPALQDRTACRLYAIGVMAPPAFMLLVRADSASVLLGGLVLAFFVLCDSLHDEKPGAARRSLAKSAVSSGANDLLSRELRALALRNSWRVIDGVDSRPAASEQEQSDHKSAERHV